MKLTVAECLTRLDDIPGWFHWSDGLVIAGFDSYQKSRGTSGDLLEIGTYLGRSAVLMGCLLRAGETLVVCDLFIEEGPTEESARENRHWYQGINRLSFERNYLRFHEHLPMILEGPSSTLAELESSGSFRIVHVDGSHAYEIVVDDLRHARRLLVADGLVIVDDWRQAHTPGVAAATWEAILETNLIPVCYTDQKLYASWSESVRLTPDQIESWGEDTRSLKVDQFQVRGRTLFRVSPRTADSQSPLRTASPLQRFGMAAKRQLSRAASRFR